MLLVPLQGLVPVVVGGVGACALGACTTGRSRRLLVIAGASVVLVAVAGAILYGAFALAVTAWDERPATARGGALALAATLVLLSLATRGRHERRRQTDEEGEDDDGGSGGQRGPSPPRSSPPGEPGPPPAPWDEFDAIRSAWDRVPAGRR